MDMPRARRDDVLTTNLEDEVVIYDPERKQAHSLNRVAVAVWNHTDGSKTIEDLQRLASNELGAPVDQAAVWLALRRLERAHLLTEKLGTGNPMTRREMLRKAGRFGVAAAVTPLVASTLVPIAAAAVSPTLCANGQPCATLGVCGKLGNCFCFQHAGGGGWCGPSILCAGATACTTDANCPAGFGCSVNTCCGAAGICEPPCPGGVDPTVQLHGQTSSGFYP